MSRKDTVLKLYNTETRQKESVPSREKDLVHMYTCGPTVYNYAHIGNFRTYMFEDLLRRTLSFFGYTVFQVMNITDVDDKTIKGALEEGVSLKAFTKRYESAFFEDLETLHIQKAESYPSAIEHIPDMISMIARLLREGIAYKGTDGSIYFSIEKFPSYGRLSHLCLHDLQVGASDRIETDEYEKEAASDFVLWKAHDPKRDGDIFWESPFGKGRPGWHIECSAMAHSLLGETIDIHCGGVDNIFPHHENEIAQSEACFGHHFVKMWLHAQHLIVDGKKMSKSLGNFYTLRDLLDRGYTGEEIRYLLLHTHYRTQLNFTMEGLESARKSLSRIRECLDRVDDAKEGETVGSVEQVLDESMHMFKKALSDDLNISEALAAVYEAVRRLNGVIDSEKALNSRDKSTIYTFFETIDQILGCLPLQKREEKIPEAIQQAVRQREEARKAKNWEHADERRDFIAQQGYEVEDTPKGPRIKKIE